MVLEFPKAPEGITDTTSRTICTTFEQYIYLYEVMAQLTRIAYCDSGIAKKVFDTEFGKDNYTVMQAIAKNDTEYNKERRIPLKDQNRASIAPGIPHESYALGPAPDTTHKYGTYIATSEVLTAYIINTTVANGILLEKGPFRDSDVIISFKGTNTFKEAIHDFKSAFMRTDLNKLVRTLGFTAKGEDGDSFINGSFTKVLLHAWNVLIKGVTEHSGTGPFRLFCTGHSLGGAYCTLFGFILGYLKTLPPVQESPTSLLLQRIESIHVISLGSPTLCADKARNVFNRSLISGLMTFDRLVTQQVGTLTSHSAFVDIIPLIPAGFSHPGFKQSQLSWKQDKKRPYKLSSIYHLYDKGNPKVYRLSAPTPREKELMKEAERAEKEGERSLTLAKTVPEGGRRMTQRGGFIFGRKHKAEYEKIALNMASNFISVPTPTVEQAITNKGAGGIAVPHLVYFGMRYVTGLRFPGMKNPVPPNYAQSAYFGLYKGPGGVLIKYYNPNDEKASQQQAESEQLGLLQRTRENDSVLNDSVLTFYEKRNNFANAPRQPPSTYLVPRGLGLGGKRQTRRGKTSGRGRTMRAEK